MTQYKKILIVNLEDTLLKSDIFLETFWSAFAKDPLIPIKIFFLILKGKNDFRKYLFDASNIDFSTIPYNKKILEYINTHYSKETKVFLLTSNAKEIAKEIIKNIKIYNEKFHPSSKTNFYILTWHDFERNKFGIKNYDFIGGYKTKSINWKKANKAITFNLNKLQRRNCEINNNDYIHIKNKDETNFLKNFLSSMRPYQWTKNILVFLPLLASQKFENQLFINSLFAFFSFCFIASSVYITNDLIDLKSDRNHPKKRNRPFARGDLSIRFGSLGALALIVLGSSLGFQLGIKFIALISIYYLLTASYSLYFKKQALIDIFILSALYTLRIIGGGISTDLTISFWLLCFSLFNFLSLAAIKRQAELKQLISIKKIKSFGRGYIIEDLNFVSFIAISSGLLSSLVLALYINSPKIIPLYPKSEFLWISCFLFLFWIIRMCFKTHKGEMEYDPIIFAAKDKTSILIFLVILILILLASNI